MAESSRSRVWKRFAATVLCLQTVSVAVAQTGTPADTEAENYPTMKIYHGSKKVSTVTPVWSQGPEAEERTVRDSSETGVVRPGSGPVDAGATQQLPAVSRPQVSPLNQIKPVHESVIIISGVTKQPPPQNVSWMNGLVPLPAQETVPRIIPAANPATDRVESSADTLASDVAPDPQSRARVGQAVIQQIDLPARPVAAENAPPSAVPTQPKRQNRLPEFVTAGVKPGAARANTDRPAPQAVEILPLVAALTQDSRINPIPAVAIATTLNTTAAKIEVPPATTPMTASSATSATAVAQALIKPKGLFERLWNSDGLLVGVIGLLGAFLYFHWRRIRDKRLNLPQSRSGTDRMLNGVLAAEPATGSKHTNTPPRMTTEPLPARAIEEAMARDPEVFANPAMPIPATTGSTPATRTPAPATTLGGSSPTSSAARSATHWPMGLRTPQTPGAPTLL